MRKNYGFEKREKEKKRQQKQEKKREKKRQSKQGDAAPTDGDRPAAEPEGDEKV